MILIYRGSTHGADRLGFIHFLLRSQLQFWQLPNGFVNSTDRLGFIHFLLRSQLQFWQLPNGFVNSTFMSISFTSHLTSVPLCNIGDVLLQYTFPLLRLEGGNSNVRLDFTLRNISNSILVSIHSLPLYRVHVCNTKRGYPRIFVLCIEFKPSYSRRWICQMTTALSGLGLALSSLS